MTHPEDASTVVKTEPQWCWLIINWLCASLCAVQVAQQYAYDRAEKLGRGLQGRAEAAVVKKQMLRRS
jgi:long-subunit fatty acid transport protein